jgi:hypothetical protein
LPTQIILQLCASNGDILSTLYFVWDNKHDDIKQRLREMQGNDDEITISYALDESAPANPNYAYHHRHKKKRRKTPTTLEFPKNNIVARMTMDLLMGEEVAPRPPVMVESVSFRTGESLSSSPRKDDTDTDTDACPTLLCAKIGYFKFGLRYILALSIPMTVPGVPARTSLVDKEGNEVDNRQEAQKENEQSLEYREAEIDLLGASLSVSIQA